MARWNMPHILTNNVFPCLLPLNMQDGCFIPITQIGGAQKNIFQAFVRKSKTGKIFNNKNLGPVR